MLVCMTVRNGEYVIQDNKSKNIRLNGYPYYRGHVAKHKREAHRSSTQAFLHDFCPHARSVDQNAVALSLRAEVVVVPVAPMPYLLRRH